jgi:hypothetical protein
MSRFDVAMFCHDKTAIVYHVPTHEELVQSLVDIAPLAGSYIHAVAVAHGGRQLSGAFRLSRRKREIFGGKRSAAPK